MRKIMEISLTFKSDANGIIIVGINPEFDALSIPEIKKIIGNYIIVKNPSSELKLEVKSTQISNSLIDKKNIGICLGDYVKIEELKIGSYVYTYDE